jgi:hypothetical protein
LLVSFRAGGAFASGRECSIVLNVGWVRAAYGCRREMVEWCTP